MAGPPLGAIKAADFVKQLPAVDPEFDGGTTAENGLPGGVSGLVGGVKRLQADINAATFVPTEGVPDVTQNERSGFGAILEGLATAADPKRADARAKAQRQVDTTNAEIAQRDKSLRLQANAQKWQALTKQNEFLLQVIGMENLQAGQLVEMLRTSGVDITQLSPEVIEGLSKKLGLPDPSLLNAVVAGSAELVELGKEQTRETIDSISAGTEKTSAETEMIIAKTNLVSFEEQILKAQADVAEPMAKAQLGHLLETVQGLKDTNDANEIRVRIQTAEAIMASLRSAQYSEELQLLLDKIRSEIDRNKAEMARIADAGNLGPLQQKAYRDRGTVMYNDGSAAIAEMAKVTDTTQPDGRRIIENQARALIDSIETEIDPDALLANNDIRGYNAMQDYIASVSRDLESDLRTNYNVDINLTRAGLSRNIAERVPATESGRKEVIMEMNRDAVSPSDLTPADYAQMEHYISTDRKIDTEAAAAWLHNIDAIQRLPFVSDVVIAPGRGKGKTISTFGVTYDREAMVAAGWSAERITEFKAAVTEQMKAHHEGAVAIRAIQTVMPSLAVAKPNVDTYIRRMLTAEKPLTLNTVQDLSGFLTDMEQFLVR